MCILLCDFIEHLSKSTNFESLEIRYRQSPMPRYAETCVYLPSLWIANEVIVRGSVWRVRGISSKLNINVSSVDITALIL